MLLCWLIGWLTGACSHNQSMFVGAQLEMCMGVSVCVRAWRLLRGEESFTHRCNQRAVPLYPQGRVLVRSPPLASMQAPSSTAARLPMAAHHIPRLPGACLGRPRFPRLACVCITQAGGWLARCTGCCHACGAVSAVHSFILFGWYASTKAKHITPRHSMTHPSLPSRHVHIHPRWSCTRLVTSSSFAVLDRGDAVGGQFHVLLALIPWRPVFKVMAPQGDSLFIVMSH